MKKLFPYLFFLLACLVMLWLSGCGARKRTKNVQERTETIQNEIVIKKSDSINTDIRLTEILKHLEITPVNDSVPNKVTINTPKGNFTIESENSKVVFKEQKKDSASSISQASNLTKTDKSKTYKSENVKEVQTERQGFNWKGLNWALFFIGVILAGVLVWNFKRN